MTDARYPEKWLSDRRILRLSAEQHRTFVVTLAWSVSNRTDGVLEREDLPLVVGCDTSAMTAATLVTQGLWEPTAAGWLIVDFAPSQTSRDELQVLDNARRREREKKARQRHSRRHPDEDVPGDVPGDASPGKAQDRQGQDRQGQDSLSGAAPRPGAEASAWPPVRAVGGAE